MAALAAALLAHGHPSPLAPVLASALPSTALRRALVTPQVLVFVGAERVRRGAGVADRGGRFEVAEGDRHAAVRQQALHVVHPVRAGLDLDQAPERAPLDPLGREPIRLRIRGDDRQWQGHRVRTGPRSHIGRATVPVGRRSLTSPEMPRQHAKRTRLAPSSEGVCATEGSWRRTAAPR